MGGIDPRSKICLSITIMIFTLMFRSTYPLLGFFWFSLILSIVAGAELGKMFKMTRFISLLIFIGTIAQNFIHTGGEIYLETGEYILLTKNGAFAALDFWLLCYTWLILLFYIATSSQRRLIQSMIAIKVPYEIALFVTFPARFHPILKQEYNNSLRVLTMKGIDFKTLPWLQKVNLRTYLWSSTFSNACIKSKELSISMETRGFRLLDEKENLYQGDLMLIDYFVIFWSIMTLSAAILFKVLY